MSPQTPSSSHPDSDPIYPEASNPDYTRHHPQWYRRRIPIFWWLRKWVYTKFILRELTSQPVMYAALLLLAHVWFVGQGPEAYETFVGWLRHPFFVALHFFVLAGLLFHTITWLNLAPKALVLRVGGRKVPDGAVLAAHYGGWLGLSVLILWLLRGG